MLFGNDPTVHTRLKEHFFPLLSALGQDEVGPHAVEAAVAVRACLILDLARVGSVALLPVLWLPVHFYFRVYE